MGFGWPQLDSNRQETMSQFIMVAGYLLMLLLAVVLWYTTRGSAGKVASLGEFFHRILHYRGTRLGLILAWWWFGWHFLVSVIHRG